jgi:hypothetical protein
MFQLEISQLRFPEWERDDAGRKSRISVRCAPFTKRKAELRSHDVMVDHQGIRGSTTSAMVQRQQIVQRLGNVESDGRSSVAIESECVWRAIRPTRSSSRPANSSKATVPRDGGILFSNEMAARAGSHYTRRTLGLGIKAFMGFKRLRYQSISAFPPPSHHSCFR